MDEFTVNAFANRDEPVPLISITHSDIDSSSDVDAPGRAARMKRGISGSRIQAKARALSAAHAEKLEASHGRHASIQDRVFSKILERVIPTEDVDGGEREQSQLDRRSSQYVTRPAFSLPLMTNNFRRFNARIGIVFVFQNRLIRLFTWRTPTHTLSFLSVFTFVCLDPHLVVVLPLAVLLLFVMVPAFMSRHPPPPPTTSTSSTNSYYSYTGPALAPATTIRPAAETSKDFFRNMRDLQNSMADFASLHDALVSTIAPPTNFSNEILSSTIFLYLTILTVSLFIAAQVFPWRLIFLLGGYAMTISGHPTAQIYLTKMQKRAEKKAAAIDKAELSEGSPSWTSYHGLPIPTLSSLKSISVSLSQMTLDTAPETREVEIFELQHRPVGSVTAEWTPHMFTPTPYDPLSPSRISGDRPRGTRFFEDVQTPSGWAWEGKKWELDIDASEWVSERLVVGVEFDVSSTGSAYTGGDDAAAVAGQSGGWVWDLPPRVEPGREEEVWLAYGEDYGLTQQEKKAKEKEKKAMKKVVSRDWEEGTRWTEQGLRTGEWRRRRWVRVVKRVGTIGRGNVEENFRVLSSG